MKITTVLTAVNNNEKYYKFVPLFIHRWKTLFPHIKIVIVFVGSKLPASLIPYEKYFVMFAPIVDVSDVFIAQTIRLLYPAVLDDEETTIITDMDMIPGTNRAYYTDKIKNTDDSKFVVFRPLSCVGPSEIAMCYSAAKTNTWKQLFNINTINDINEFLKNNYKRSDGIHGGIGWNQDQLILYNHVNNNHSIVVFLDDSYYNRLDCHHHRYNIDMFISLSKVESFSDIHLYADACPWSIHDILTIIRKSI